MTIRLTQRDIDLAEEISLYARISVDTEKESDENTSIENQLKIMHDHIQKHFPNCTYKEYIDRDRSGYTFEQRENYMQMRHRLLSGKSKILIVKDFSRFSRRTSKGLGELEDYRDNGIRIISIMDSVDFPADDKWEMIAMRFIMNEMPARTLQRKCVLLSISDRKPGSGFVPSLTDMLSPMPKRLCTKSSRTRPRSSEKSSVYTLSRGGGIRKSPTT